ncbi:MAG: glycine cleavage system protein GcvH [Lachnospiraceae bacterium]|nr:glycine cleavage system protein GcvH [Lachnospiraceae bacterium]MBR6349186.1 glycine cleavage system protein GcvH [Lachnospiraceae bacterium]
MYNPDDVKYSSEHTWAQIEGDTARIGITDYGQECMGDVLYIDFPNVGVNIGAGEVLLEIETSDTGQTVYSPLSGEVTAINRDVDDSPELINEDPYGAWIVEMILSDPDEEDDLMDADEYEEYLE